MLNNDFYTIIGRTEQSGESFRTSIRFNATHDIFKGHFPGLPVVPGVCMMALVKELLEDYQGVQLQLVTTSQIKFLSLINPLENDSAEVEIKYDRPAEDSWLIDAVIYVTGKPYFKMNRAVYR